MVKHAYIHTNPHYMTESANIYSHYPLSTGIYMTVPPISVLFCHSCCIAITHPYDPAFGLTLFTLSVMLYPMLNCIPSFNKICQCLQN